MTEYRSEFVPREGGARESFKPDYALQTNTAPLQDETTHKCVKISRRNSTHDQIFFFFSRHDYIKHALDKPRSFKPEEVYVPRGDFDSMTSYNKEYTRRMEKKAFVLVD